MGRGKENQVPNDFTFVHTVHIPSVQLQTNPTASRTSKFLIKSTVEKKNLKLPNYELSNDVENKSVQLTEV